MTPTRHTGSKGRDGSPSRPPPARRPGTPLETFFAKIDELADTSHALAKLREFALQLAVTGRFLPQDPNDEPAEATVAKCGKLARPPRYESRSNARIEGVGALSLGPTIKNIPSGWTCIPLIEIARLESGHTPSRSRPDWWGGNVPWIGVVDARIHDGKTIFETIQHTNEEGLANSAARLLPAGTVCVSRTASVGYVVTMGRSMATSQDFVNWVPSTSVTSAWLRLVLTAEKPGFHLFSKGAVHQTIYYPEWLSMHTLLPPLAEQKRIVAKVDELMALCDRLEAQLTERESRARRIERAALARFAEAPTPANLELLFHNKFAISPADLRKTILTVAIEGGFSKNRAASDSFRDAAVGDVVDLLGGYAFKSEWFVKRPGVRLVRNQNISHGDLDWTETEYLPADRAADFAKWALRPGDLVLSLNRPFISTGLKLAWIRDEDFPCLLVQRIVCLRPDRQQLLAEYLFLWCNAPQFYRDAHVVPSSGVPYIAPDRVAAMMMRLPSLDEQRRIVAKVDHLMTLVDKLEAQLTASRTTADHLLSALVAELTAA